MKYKKLDLPLLLIKPLKMYGLILKNCDVLKILNTEGSLTERKIRTLVPTKNNEKGYDCKQIDNAIKLNVFQKVFDRNDSK
jgi:hypothetical protein